MYPWGAPTPRFAVRARLRATVLVLVLVVACSDATITRIPADPDEVDEGLDGIDELADADPDPDGIDSADADPDLIDPEGDDPDGDDTVIDPDADELLVDPDPDPDREPDPGCGPGLEGTPCNDGKGCTVRDTCRADGSCTGDPACPAVPPPTECMRAPDPVCDEVQGCRPAVPVRTGFECTTDDQRRGRCNQGVCRECACGPEVTICCPDGCDLPRPETPCDDGNPRTYGEVCGGGRCMPGRPCECDAPSTCCDGCRVRNCPPGQNACVQGQCTTSPNLEDCAPCTAGWECVSSGCIVMPGRTRALCGLSLCLTDADCRLTVNGVTMPRSCVQGYCAIAARSGAPANSSCCESSDCADGLQCWQEWCVPRCERNDQCGSAARCNAGQCERVR